MSLSRKYRPKIFEDVVGQQHIKITLRNEIESGKIAHAFIFCGPRGVGKTTLARILARAVNCENRGKMKGEPCNDCISCRRILDGGSFDIIEIDAASHTGVDNVRLEIIENIRFAPLIELFKVFIIDEAHMLSTAAFNALLKTLEEPPDRVIFILATTEVHKLPETILSRCQRFNFRRLSVEEIVARLRDLVHNEKRNVDDNLLYEIARLGEGCVRDAETLLGQIFSLDEKHIRMEDARMILPESCLREAIELLEIISRGDQMGALEYLNSKIEDGVSPRRLLDEMVELLRKILLGSVGNTLFSHTHEFSDDIEKRILKLVEVFRKEDIVKFIQLLLDSLPFFGKTSVEHLPLELAFMQYFLLHPRDESLQQKQISSVENSSLHPWKKNETKENTNHDISPIKPIMIDLDQIQKKWQDVLAVAGDFNHSLNLILRLISLTKDPSGVIIFLCPYPFHKEKLEEIKTRQVLFQIFERVYGGIFHFRVEVNGEKEIKKEIEESDNEVKNLLSAFGGELIS